MTDSAYLGSESTYSECETFTDEDTGALVPPEMHEDVETDSGIEATLHDPEDGGTRSGRFLLTALNCVIVNLYLIFFKKACFFIMMLKYLITDAKMIFPVTDDCSSYSTSLRSLTLK